MKPNFSLLLLGIVLFGVMHWIFHKYLFTAIERQDPFNSALFITVLCVLFIPAFELTMVGLGQYRTKYTGSRFFKGILY